MRSPTIAGRGGRLRAAVGPALLLAVLASHVSLRTSANLTPWKGGGFGMFSTIDSPATRQVRVDLQGDDGETPVAVPAGFTALANEVRAAPSTERLADLARSLAGQAWVVPRISRPDAPPSPERDLIDGMALQAMAQVAPLDTVRAIDPGAFDPARQQKVAVRAVQVTVWRLQPGVVEHDGTTETLRPARLGRVSVPVPDGGPR
jgi:hypothetical protein